MNRATSGFGGIRLAEYEPIDVVVALARFVSEYGPLGAAVLEYFCGDFDEATEALTNGYRGCYASLADYVQETTAIPDALRFYIDWQAMARDAELSGDLCTVSTAWDEIHVFVGC